MGTLSSNLVPFIAELALSTVVVETTARTPAAQSAPSLEEGKMSYQVLDVLHSGSLKKGDAIEVPYTRDADELTRAKRGFNQWNTLALEPGELLILACKPLDPPKVWQGLAAEQVGTVNDSEVDQVRRCYAIEKEDKPAENKRDQLQELLIEGKDIDRRYAVHALTKRALLPRAISVDMLDQAITSAKTSPEDKLELARNLLEDRIFKDRKGAEAVNQKVVSTLSRGLAAEGDPERQREWMDVLSFVVLSEFSDNAVKNHDIRTALVRGVDPDVSKRVLAILTQQAAQGTEEDREIAQELLTPWKAAAAKK